MNKKRLVQGFGAILILVLSLSGTGVHVALADDGTPPAPTPIVVREGGPVVHRELAVPSDKSLLSANAASAAIYRAGWTDAWRTWDFRTWDHYGGHNSQSDLVEQNIWADGSLKVNGTNVASCSNHTSGQYAYCSTVKNFALSYSVTAKSWHYFHKSGYVDQNFTTSKSI